MRRSAPSNTNGPPKSGTNSGVLRTCRVRPQVHRLRPAPAPLETSMTERARQPERPDPSALTEWLRGDGHCADVVMSSRVRLARNVAGFAFANRASRPQRLQVLDSCRAQLESAPIGAKVIWHDLHR